MKKSLLKKIGICILAGAMSISLISCGGAAGSKNSNNTSSIKSNLEEIKSKGKLVIGTSADYPPYEFHKPINGKDEIVGFDIDIAKEFAKDLGVQLEVKEMSFDGLLVALQSDKIDMIFSSMTPTEERKENADFSDIYYTAPQDFVVRSGDDASITSMKDFKGKKIGVLKGSIQEGIAKDNFDSANIKALEKATDLTVDLKNNKVDAILIEGPVAQISVEKNTGIVIAHKAEIIDPIGGVAVAMKKNSPELLAEVNKTIKKLKDEKKIEKFALEANKLVD